jgi:hypothetical protein
MNDHAIVLAPFDRQKVGMLTGSFSVPGVLCELSHGLSWMIGANGALCLLLACSNWLYTARGKSAPARGGIDGQQ